MSLLVENVVTLKYTLVISLSLMGAINFHSFFLYALC